MAGLSREEKRNEQARKHTRRTWDCPLCGQVCRGNGGKSAHRRKHLRDAGLTAGDWRYLIDHRAEYGFEQ